jgi:hypothetical protein
VGGAPAPGRVSRGPTPRRRAPPPSCAGGRAAR